MVSDENDVTNYGSAIGEAIGAIMQNSINKFLEPIVQSLGYSYIYRGPFNPKSKKYTKLILTDEYGTEYNIDAVIINEKFQPIVLMEFKYIRYEKHNRDKGSWVCTCHQSLRNRFPSVRSSITILAGNWSSSSKAMMKSFNITLIEIPFSDIAKILGEYDIDFYWKEKERERAKAAWNQFCTLTNDQKNEIGEKMISLISDDLKNLITQILDDSTPREIKTIEIHIISNLGEIKKYIFTDIEKAISFLNEINNSEELLEELLKTDKSPTIF